MTPFIAGWLADLILLLHVGIVAFAVLGQLLFMAGGLRGWAWVRKLWVRLAHLVLIAFVVLQSWLGQVCPSRSGSSPCDCGPGKSPTPNRLSSTGSPG